MLVLSKKLIGTLLPLAVVHPGHLCNTGNWSLRGPGLALQRTVEKVTPSLLLGEGERSAGGEGKLPHGQGRHRGR
uniref:Putative secreted protein n=1 Tax=Ixodes ricinus TaxID=34613 RepID=A0A6B0U4P3_IXORI